MPGNCFRGLEFSAGQGQECTEVEGLLSQSAFVEGFVLWSRSTEGGIEVLQTMAGMDPDSLPMLTNLMVASKIVISSRR